MSNKVLSNISSLFGVNAKQAIFNGSIQNFKKEFESFVSTNKSIKRLEIINVDEIDNWDFLQTLPNLKHLLVKNIYIDSDSFYQNLLELKKIESLTYNHFTYFSKILEKKKLNNKQVPSLKNFIIEFPNQSDVSFDFMYGSIKEKNNSITIVPQFEKVFQKLETIQLLNYENYLELIYKENYESDGWSKWKMKEEIKENLYFGMSYKDLKNFPSLKQVLINSGDYNSLFVKNIFAQIAPHIELINFNEFTKTNYKSFFKNKSLAITPAYEGVNFRVSNELNTIQLNPFVFPNFYFKGTTKEKMNNLFQNALDHQYETIMFSPFYDVIDSVGVFGHGQWSDKGKNQKKIINFLGKQKKIKKIILDINLEGVFHNKTKADLEDAKNHNNIVGLVYFIQEILLEFPNVTIEVRHKEFGKSLVTEMKDPILMNHFIYFINFYLHLDSKYKDKIILPGLDTNQFKEIYDEYLLNKCDQLLVIDDVLFDNSNKFPDLDLFYLSEFGYANPGLHYLDFKRIYNDKSKGLLNNSYKDLLRIWSNSMDYENFDKNKPFAVVNSSFLKNANKKIFNNISIYYLYVGHPHHTLHNSLTANEKTTVNSKRDPDSDLHLATKKIKQFCSTGDIKNKDQFQKALLSSYKDFKVYKGEELKAIGFHNLKSVAIEGVNPWQSHYVYIKDISKLFPTKHLDSLRLRDCLKESNAIEGLENLKKIELGFNPNSHWVESKKIKYNLFNFKNLQSIEKITISKVFSMFFYSTDEDYGFRSVWDDTLSNRWHFMEHDFSGIETLSKLKSIYFKEIYHKDLQAIQSLPFAEVINITVFNKTKSLDESTDDLFVGDNSFEFLKKTKNLKKFILSIGNEIDHNGESDYEKSIPHDSYYYGNGDFIDYISHNITTLKLDIPLRSKDLSIGQDIINKILNRFLKLETLELSFMLTPVDEDKYRDALSVKLKKNIRKVKTKFLELDVAQLAKMKNLQNVEVGGCNDYVGVKFKNFKDLHKLKKIKTFSLEDYYYYDRPPVSKYDLKQAVLVLKNERFENPHFYDEDYNYRDEEENEYWNRTAYINTSGYDWVSLENYYKNFNEKKGNE